MCLVFGFFSYKFSDSGVYYIPNQINYYGSLRYIKKLPLNPSPEVFGLHDNANITKGNQETMQVSFMSSLHLEFGKVDFSSFNLFPGSILVADKNFTDPNSIESGRGWE